MALCVRFKDPPTYTLPAIPTPPATRSAPVAVFVDAVVCSMFVLFTFIRSIPDDVFPIVVSFDTPNAEGVALAPMTMLFEPVKLAPPAL